MNREDFFAEADVKLDKLLAEGRLRIVRPRALAPAVPSRRHARPSKPERGVYVVATYDFRHVKIGRTENMIVRFKELQTSNPMPLQYIGMLHSDPKEEPYVQQRFKTLRMHGEWFRCRGELRTFLHERFPDIEELRLKRG